LAEALDIHQPVTSPTFTLVQEYQGRLPLVHIDLYRLHDPEELLQLGLDDYLDGPNITVLEWADRAAGLLPPRTWTVTLRHRTSPHEREILIQQGLPAC
jgi:tRNA threonylcarbamoyladenosine biosynthesis protein TsaE